jgi:hypothetical protein
MASLCRAGVTTSLLATEASMLDLAFVMLGVGILALTGLYAAALQRI